MRTCFVSLMFFLVASCASPGSNPYAPADPGRRDSMRAQALTQEAAALLHKDPERAEALLRDALTADLYHGPAHNNLGVLYLEQDRLYEAAGEFEWARKLMPGHPDPRLNLGLTLEQAGRVDEALAAFDSALEVYPDHIPTMQATARCRLRHGRADASTAELLDQIALVGEDEHWRAWAQRQRALMSE